MDNLRRELDVSKDKHGIDLVALHFKKDIIALLNNQPIPAFTENGVLFGQIKISHNCNFLATEGTGHTEL